jgi:histidinol phosphatase-like enzyme
MTAFLTIIENPSDAPDEQDIERAVHLKNKEWAIIAQALEAFSATFRANYSQVVATYVTRGQLQEASTEAAKMNNLLQQLDKIQSTIV